HVRRFHANFSYQAGTWTKPRRVIAKVEWHPGELYPRVGFIVTNMSRPAERVVAFYNKRGTCEQWIKEGKGAIKWTRLSCRTFAANAVRLELQRWNRRLGDYGGLKNYGVNFVRVGSGGQSSARHAHTKQDEFVYIIEGEFVLVTDAGRETVGPGTCIAFP